VISLNNEVVEAFKEMKKDGKPLISGKIIQVEKDLELVKKLMKDP
jgi:hypothetical protein